MCLPSSRDSLSRSETRFLSSRFVFFFLQSESDVSHHPRVLTAQEKSQAHARRTLGVSPVMSLPL